MWLPSGEEILEKSGILSWREDLQHLQNQLSKEQPGCCDSFDTRQMKRDERVLREEVALEAKKRKSDADIAEFEKSCVIKEESSENESNEESDEEFQIKEPKSRNKKKHKTQHKHKIDM